MLTRPIGPVRGKKPLQNNDLIGTLGNIGQLAQQVLAAHADMKRMHGEIMTHLSSIKQGPPGRPGAPGPRGQDGRDADHQAIIEAVMKKIPFPKNGRDGLHGRDGKSVDPEEVLSKIKEKKLKVEHIDGLDQTLSVIRNFAARGGVRGGGDTVAAGTGVSITQSNGVKTISASGITRLAATGTVDGSNTAFTFASKPTYIVSDGAWYIENTGWTWNAGTLTATMSVAPQTNIFGIS